MFEQIFDEYRKAVDSSFKMQQEMYRQWMNGWPVKPPDVTKAVDRGAFKDQIRSYQKKWSQTLAESMEKHREVAQSAVQERYRRDRVGVSHDRSADARGILAIDPGILAEKHRFVQDDVRGSEQVRRGPGPDVAGDGNPGKGVRHRQYVFLAAGAIPRVEPGTGGIRAGVGERGGARSCPLWPADQWRELKGPLAESMCRAIEFAEPRIMTPALMDLVLEQQKTALSESFRLLQGVFNVPRMLRRRGTTVGSPPHTVWSTPKGPCGCSSFIGNPHRSGLSRCSSARPP